MKKIVVRQYNRSSLIQFVRRGTICILAFILLLNPIKVFAEDINATQPALKISWIYFRSNTQTNNTGGNTTDQAWLIYNFEFDKPYTGTMRSILSYTCGYGYVPYMMVDGVYYTVQTTVTNDGTTSTTRQNTFDFVLTDTKSFKIIITVANTYLNYGGITTPSMDLTASDGSSGSGVDYTNILTDILGYSEDTVLSLDEVNQHLASIEDTSSDILDVLNEINDAVGDYQAFFIYHDMPEYQKFAVRQFISFGYTWNFTNTTAQRWGWCLTKPANFSSTSRQAYLIRDYEYTLIFISHAATPATIKFHQENKSYTITASAIRANSAYLEGSYYSVTFQPNVTDWFYLENATNLTYIQPIYFGPTQSMPDAVTPLINRKSIRGFIQDIKNLLSENNAQNDQMIDQLDNINQDTDTITHQIDTFNTDFNNAMSNIPIGSTTEQLQSMQSAFQATSGWMQNIYDALGKLKLVIVIGLILILVNMFRGKK